MLHSDAGVNFLKTRHNASMFRLCVQIERAVPHTTAALHRDEHGPTNTQHTASAFLDVERAKLDKLPDYAPPWDPHAVQAQQPAREQADQQPQQQHAAPPIDGVDEPARRQQPRLRTDNKKTFITLARVKQQR